MICFDIDGVLRVYDRNDYVQNSDGTYPYHQRGHYANKEADKTAVYLFNRCVKSCKGNVFVITSIPKIPTSNYVIIDDIIWLDNKVDDFDLGAHLIAPKSDKFTHIEWIRESTLKKSDILIDDWNDNLYSWMAKGGTAIKYLNGINSAESWNGPVLDSTKFEGPELFITLMSYVYEATR